MTEKIRAIIQATENLIREKGCEQTTLQDIIKKSQSSKGAVYHHVNSKDELYAKILENNMFIMDQDFLIATSYENLEDPLKSISENGVGILTDEKNINNEIFFYLLAKSHQKENFKILDNVYEKLIKLSESWIVKGQEAGHINSELDPKDKSKLFITYAFGLRIRVKLEPENNRDIVKEFYDFMYHILKVVSE